MNRSTLPIGLSVGDLLEYTAWQRARWREWFLTHPEALRVSAGPNGDGRFATIGDLVKHIFGAEQRYVERLTDQPLTNLEAIRSDDSEGLFAFGDAARLSFAQYVDSCPAEAWDVSREMKILNFRVIVTPKKVVMHVLLHEVRHWAQIATLCRVNGFVGEFHDFLTSPVLGGEFTPV
jgi:uncharacterized damage-inducible protein DinB